MVNSHLQLVIGNEFTQSHNVGSNIFGASLDSGITVLAEEYHGDGHFFRGGLDGLA